MNHFKYVDFLGNERIWPKSLPRRFQPHEKSRIEVSSAIAQDGNGVDFLEYTDVAGTSVDNVAADPAIDIAQSLFTLDTDLVKDKCKNDALIILASLDYTYGTYVTNNTTKFDAYEAYKLELRKWVNKTEDPTSEIFPVHPYPASISNQLYIFKKQGLI